jgi:hypothetical protein
MQLAQLLVVSAVIYAMLAARLRAILACVSHFRAGKNRCHQQKTAEAQSRHQGTPCHVVMFIVVCTAVARTVLTNCQAVAFGIRALGLGGATASTGSASAPVSDSGGSSGSGSASLSTKLLPLQPTITFPFNPQDSNTPITGIVPLPCSHYACVSATSGQIRMCVRSVIG